MSPWTAPRPWIPLRGYAVRQPIAADAPLSRAALVGPGQRGFLAAVLRPGTRAATIRPGESVQHAGLIDPGDLVDVILTARLRIDKGPEQVVTRTILEKVRVLAVDRRVVTGGEGGEEVKRTRIVTATLEVSPAEAGLLALGEQEGNALPRRPPFSPRHPRHRGGERRRRCATCSTCPSRNRKSRPRAAKPVEPAREAEAALVPRSRTVRVIRGSKVSDETFGGQPGEPTEGGPAPRQGLPGAPVPAVVGK